MKLSIVTINYNNAVGLQKTIDSVAAQTYKEFEHIIVDGNSHDEGVSIIQGYDYEQRISNQPHPVIRWISEPDSGIYNAMNKGLRMCQGEYVLMLNSGDYLVNEHTIERMMPELDGTDIVQGNTIDEHDGKCYRNRGYGRTDISMYDVMEGVFLHQASFCKKELFNQYGYFDESYKIGADTKFFAICLGFHNATFKYVDIDVTNYDCNGISAATDGPWYQKHREEYVRLRRELFSPRMESYLRINEPKVQWYDRLHQHRWIWNMVRTISRIHNCFYCAPKHGVRKEKIGF